ARVLAKAPNRLVVVGPPRQGSASSPSVRALAGLTWLLREAGSGTRDATDDLLADLGIEPPTMILGSNGAIEQTVVAGLGVALISLSAVADSIATGAIVVYSCPGTPLDRPWHLVAHASRTLSPTAHLLARSITEVPNRFVLTAEGRRVLQP
ncbi:MAG: LysR substrate-binding domain-containing protein, partial [Actinomycetota bacterium]|nr:LysR substrate-binding domain-containing protein [Actinomycetota bacterium]